jgi:hypothetical protein
MDFNVINVDILMNFNVWITSVLRFFFWSVYIQI